MASAASVAPASSGKQLPEPKAAEPILHALQDDGDANYADGEVELSQQSAASIESIERELARQLDGGHPDPNNVELGGCDPAASD